MYDYMNVLSIYSPCPILAGFITDTGGSNVANATVSVVGIDHDLVSTADGEYWRLLSPGSYTITVDAPGYLTATQTVSVEEGAARQFTNFTLVTDDWSVQWDFDLQGNLAAESYLNNEELKAALASIENSYPTIVEALINEADWQMETPALKLSMDDEEEKGGEGKQPPRPRKLRLLLVGGLYGSQPVGRELLLRLARHIGEGVKQGENVITMILKGSVIYIVPAVDMEGFSRAKVGSCHYGQPEKEMEAEAGNQFFSENKGHVGARALKTLMSRVQFDLALSLEGNGMFVRVPFDDGSVETSSGGTAVGMETVDWLAATYLAAHTGMGNISDPCQGKVLNGQAVPANAFPTGVLAGHNIRPPMYHNSFLDFVWKEMGVPAISAHVSCCNYPRPRHLLSLYKENMIPLVRVLSRAHQGVWGIVLSGQDKQPLVGAEININGRVVKTDEKGEYLAVMPVGAFKLEASAEGYGTKQMSFSVEEGFIARRDVLLESSAESQLEYHTVEQVLANLRSLEVQYPDHARLYTVQDSAMSAPPLQAIQIGGHGLKADEDRPSVRLLGRGILGAELAANLADWLVTRIGRDDTVTTLVAGLDLHIGIIRQPDEPEVGMPTSELCPRADNISRLLAASPVLATWESQYDFLLGLDFFAGSDSVWPSDHGPELG